MGLAGVAGAAVGTAVHIGTDRLLASFAAVAKYYGVAVDVWPPRAGNRKGAVEAANRYIAQRWWRTANVDTMDEAQASLDGLLAGPADRRRRGGAAARRSPNAPRTRDC